MTSKKTFEIINWRLIVVVNTNNPNIFNFATSELTQDAFLCWLISWLRFPKGELHKCAKDLVKLFYNNYQKGIIKSKKRITKNQSLELVKLDKSKFSDDEKYVLRQKHKIDILFQVRIDGNKDRLITFVIEDKTWTKPGKEQLKTYRKKIRNDKHFKNSEFVFIYFKTGYVFESEQIKKDKFYLFDWKQFGKFLSKYETITNQIFTSYKEFFRTNYYDLIISNLDKLYKEDGFETFKFDFAQWEFMTQLSKKCKEMFSSGINNYSACVYKDTSYGRPWTEFEFVKIRNEVFESEVVYYRLDFKNPPEEKSGYCISLCQYSNIDTKNIHLIKVKKERLTRYRKLFLECDIDMLNFEKKISNRGIKQTEIARIHFDNHGNSVQRILEFLPAIHSQFIVKISKEKSFGEI